MKKHTVRFAQTNRRDFEAIVSSLKTVETRAATIKYQNIKAGDILVIVCGPDRIEKIILKVHNFPSIEALFQAIKMQRVIPWAKNLDDAKTMYYSFPGYKAKIEQHGLVAFELD